MTQHPIHPNTSQGTLRMLSTLMTRPEPVSPPAGAAGSSHPTDQAVSEPAAAPQGQPSAAPAVATQRTGLHEEALVWSGRYSYKNFIGRVVLLGVLTLAWLGLATYTWGADHSYERLPVLTWVFGGLLLLGWVVLAWRVARARLGFYYELTTKRLFIATGVFYRRRDQVELIRIDDLYVKQPSLFYRMFDFGTVVVESSEEKMPISHLIGVDHPHQLMDLLWHHARSERDLHSVKVDEL